MSDTCKGKICPMLSGGGKLRKCIEHRCAHYQEIMGKHPQTGEVLNHWDCAFNWTNILLIDAAKEVRQAAAAVESFRNESVSSSKAMAGGLLAVAKAAQRAGGGQPGATEGLALEPLRLLSERKDVKP
jgi:hypothetical protein